MNKTERLILENQRTMMIYFSKEKYYETFFLENIGKTEKALAPKSDEMGYEVDVAEKEDNCKKCGSPIGLGFNCDGYCPECYPKNSQTSEKKGCGKNTKAYKGIEDDKKIYWKCGEDGGRYGIFHCEECSHLSETKSEVE